MNFLFFLKNVLFFTYEYLVSTLNSSINCSPTTQGQLQFLFFFTHWKKQKKKQKMKDVWKVLSSENLEEVMISWSASDDTQASRSPMYIVVVVLSLCVYDKVTISCFCFFSFFFCNFPSCFRSVSLWNKILFYHTRCLPVVRCQITAALTNLDRKKKINKWQKIIIVTCKFGLKFHFYKMQKQNPQQLSRNKVLLFYCLKGQTWNDIFSVLKPEIKVDTAFKI